MGKTDMQGMGLGNDDFSNLVTSAKLLIESGATQEDIILYLREITNRKALSIKLFSVVFGVSIKTAKELIQASPTWRDTLESDLALQEAFVDTLVRMRDA